MTERRRFSARQRRSLFRRTGGRCANCDAPLESGWHADHVRPHSKGGPTNTLNGQALCPDCNLAKGANLTYNDSFSPRPFQREVIESVLDGIATGRKVTVALGTPGTGKTLAYQAAATQLLREDVIDYVAVFVPRISLAQQCETSWMYRDIKAKPPRLRGKHELFDATCRLGKIRHVDNTPPFTEPGAVGTGFVACYASLTGDARQDYIDWAETHRGRFLLVADEAQFCGAPDEKGNGTRSGAVIEEMHEYATHTLLLTGTPYRADDRPLVLADYSDEDEDGRQRLIRQVNATYADGIDGGYLRRYEMLMHHGKIRETEIGGQWKTEYNLSTVESNLAPILRKPSTWQPLADRVVHAVREKQRVDPEYRGLISCMQRQDADACVNYLQTTYPGLKVRIAVSADGAIAQRALQEFKTQPADILVTVRMAFIGYDCPTITVVGVLTNYRDPGHLMQLIGRGLRTWDGAPAREQSCHVIAPDDARMNEFLAGLREESDEGLRRRLAREGDPMDGAPRDACGTGPLTDIETELTDYSLFGPDVEVEPAERKMYETLKHQHGMTEDITKLVAFAQDLGLRQKMQPPPDEASQTFTQDVPRPQSEAPGEALTDQQQIKQLKSETAEVIRRYLAARGVRKDQADYSDYMMAVTSRVNKAAGNITSAQVRTVEQAEARLEAARRVCAP